jgi:hypothetical protein
MIGLLGVSDPLYAALPRDVLLDSNLRFLSGVWLGVGLALLWTLPRIERQTALFRALWGMIFLGGVGRLISMAALATPPTPFIAFTVLEIVGAPLIVWWQSRLADGSESTGAHREGPVDLRIGPES